MIRIVIAEDQELLLGAIGSLLDLEEDMEVLGLANNGEEAVRLVHQMKPDVCIMDMEMPQKTGIEAAEELKLLECKVIILTTFARNGCYKRVIEAGIRGYLLKDSPSEELAGSIRSIVNGNRIYTPELMDQAAGPDAPAPVTPIKSVKTYFSTLKDKIKLPAG
ncbi:response regulator transcription factor [Bacillus sp. Marseille-Q1617]|uniref:response regulator n=1 Tax=Bacillus sp. Marseille-Q1617 TaxID=2736887 RepID=UPI00158CDA3A|nr:response regulator transcription factor [Bacillus sp. Marseille-Q1617]